MEALEVNRTACSDQEASKVCTVSNVSLDTVIFPQEYHGYGKWHLYFSEFNGKGYRSKRALVCGVHHALLLKLMEQTMQDEKDEYAATVYDQVRRESAEQALHRIRSSGDVVSYRVDYP